jgi:UDP-glucose 4-epimerase
MRIAVTGSTGFIGSHLCVEFARSGHQVVATSRDPTKVPALGNVPGIQLARGDLSDATSWPAALAGCDALVHVALGWGEGGPAMLRADTEGSVLLFQAAIDAGIRTIVYTSSTAACGEMSSLNGEDAVPRPVDFYGATKAATEAYLRAFGHTAGAGVHIVRPGYIFGEPVVDGAHAQPDGRFRALVRSVLRGEDVHLVKHDGTQFLHAQDLSKVYLALLAHQASPSVHYALSNRWVSWEEIAVQASKLAGKPPKLAIEDRGYGAEPFLFDVSRIRNDFGLAFGNEDRLGEHLRWELSRI